MRGRRTRLRPLQRLRCDGADIIVHCAAIAGIDTVIKSPVTTMRVNMVGSANVLEAASATAAARSRRLLLDERGVRPARLPLRGDRLDRDRPGRAKPAGPTRVSKLAEEHLAIAYHRENGACR